MAHSEHDLPPDLLRRVEEARRTGAWTSPRAQVVERLLSLSGEIAPAPAVAMGDLSRSGGDARAAALAVDSPEALVTRVFAEGELGLSAQRAEDGVGMVLRGRVWLRDGGHSQVLLVHGDHVLAMAVCESGGEFRFDELEVPGWELEVHVSSGRVLRIYGF